MNPIHRGRVERVPTGEMKPRSKPFQPSLQGYPRDDVRTAKRYLQEQNYHARPHPQMGRKFSRKLPPPVLQLSRAMSCACA